MIGVVVIGRNEGGRLVRCLASIEGDPRIVYVDSGSTDDSVAIAAGAGAHVVNLDLSVPFTAARARNAGRATLGHGVDLVQFVDGDCVLCPGWLAVARDALAVDRGLAAVIGDGREFHPELSRYNWLCDLEWRAPPGPARYFGGIVMLRADALDAVGGYPEDMIAGEEPDLAIRLRAAGWRIERLAAPMMLHDAAMTRFAQWWRRSVRAGHAYADLAARHGGDYRRRLLGALFWAVFVPVSAVIVGIWTSVVGLCILLLPLLQYARLGWRERRHGARGAATLALFLMLAKPAQALGAARYWSARLARRRPRLIEYKAIATADGHRGAVSSYQDPAD